MRNNPIIRFEMSSHTYEKVPKREECVKPQVLVSRQLRIAKVKSV